MNSLFDIETYSQKCNRERRILKCHRKIAYTIEFIDHYAKVYQQFKYHCGVCNYWHLGSIENWSNKNEK